MAHNEAGQMSAFQHQKDRALPDLAEEKQSVKRAEWISIAALMLTLASGIFQLGVVWQSQQDQERRLIVVENDNKILIPKVERIDANVSFLAEQAREDRRRQ
jgi:hypothetical protein